MRYLSICALAAWAVLAPRAEAAPSYQEVVKSYIDWSFRAYPLGATASGVHDYDDQLDDVSPKAHAAAVTELKQVLAALQAADAAGLKPEERDDREALIGQIKGSLLYELQIPTWRTDPNQYLQLATGAVFSLVQRDFAPLETRLHAAIAREKLIPAMLAQGRRNLRNSPKAFVEIALQNASGAVDFFKTIVPQAFAPITDPAQQAELKSANDAVIAAVEAYNHHLKTDLLPHAHGSYALGAKLMAERLADFELIKVPLDQLRRIAEQHLHQEQQEFRAVATKVEPGGTLAAATAKLQADHPTAEALVGEAGKELAGLKQFIADHHILTIPPEADLHVAETPEFARALVIAEFDPPGPLEKGTKDAFYYVSPPASTLTAKETEDYLGAFDYSDFLITSTHEVWPGHYMQYLSNRAHPEWSIVRKLAGAQSTTEGWAHYTEQMMVDEGLGDGAPLLKLGQLEEALLRDCRAVVALKMHTAGMSVAEATKFFVKQCYVPEPAARPEAYRGTSDPGYMTYTIGKLAILKLREDYRKQRGDKFSLGDFHDRFLGAGLIPIPLIRRELLGAEGELL